MIPPREHQWDFTQVFRDAERNGNLPKINVGSRHLIGRDTPINGGFSASMDEPDWVIVDDQRDLNLQQAYMELLRRLRERGWDFKQFALSEVFKYVQEKIPYDKKIYAKISGDSIDERKPIPLTNYFQGGVCKHQALLAAYLLEKLVNAGALRGKVSFDSNRFFVFGGHAWVRYTNSVGTVFIIDPSQNYCDQLSPVDQDRRWQYERPEEMQEYMDFINRNTLIVPGLAEGGRRKLRNAFLGLPVNQF